MKHSIILLMLNALRVLAQDTHFTQFYQLPQVYNAARSGLHEQDFRASAHYKRQWASAGEGYGTQAVNAESALLQGNPSGNRLGLGLFVVNDQAGKAQIRTLMVMTGIAYHLMVSQKSKLSFGLQFGYIQRGGNLNGLAWDAQYNGTEYDPALDNKESVYTITTDKGVDLGGGFNWSVKKRNTSSHLGYAFRHLGQDQTMLKKGEDRLPVRHTMQASYFVGKGYIGWRGDLLLQRQQGAMEVMAGVRGEYRIGSDSRYTDVFNSSAIVAGVYYRYGDAISPVIGFEWKRLASVSLSYDLPLTNARKVVGLAGGPEITLIYMGNYDATRKLAK